VLLEETKEREAIELCVCALHPKVLPGNSFRCTLTNGGHMVLENPTLKKNLTN